MRFQAVLIGLEKKTPRAAQRTCGRSGKGLGQLYSFCEQLIVIDGTCN
ncbi:hypothetical protein CNE_BB2p01470 (plasmid) [Cupriavidus necator N-1]|uniref:Uncharacterized protein n=1 Tax=Cupriavidus necator (strain ATCC 43291 / DSM 13513 / CCUG 52238 / LMG 8453 / N-1) TaxID=1042878 RepID=F8GYL7_CUPNN|nr:hypothetical protein CNE_BB2p01470 [Cupriavidus necator N-1]